MSNVQRRIMSILLALALFTPRGAAHHERALRKLSICAAADPEFRAIPNWEQVIKRRIAKVSDLYESNFNIQFSVVNYIYWNTIGFDADQLLKSLNEIKPAPNADLLVGFSGKPAFKGRDQIGGDSESFVPTVALFSVAQYDDEMTWRIAAHEITHVFGMWDQPKTNSIMSNVNFSATFSDTARKVLAITRDFDFHRGVEQLSRAQRQYFTKLYVSENADHRKNRLLTPRLSAGDRLFDSGEYDKAERQYRAAIALDPDDSQPHFDLGRVLGTQKRIQAASSEFREASRISPNWPESHYYYALCLAHLGKCAMARKEAELAKQQGFSPPVTDPGLERCASE